MRAPTNPIVIIPAMITSGLSKPRDGWIMKPNPRVEASISAATKAPQEEASATRIPVSSMGSELGIAILKSSCRFEAPKVCPTHKCTDFVCLMPE